MSELKSEEVKNAIAARLLQVAPEAVVYKEAVTSPRYPHFFVHLISLSDEEQRKRHHVLTYSLDLRYRVASDPSTDLRLEQKLDEMGMRLCVGLDIIDCTDIKVRVYGKNYEKQDGVLHFFCNVSVQADLVNADESARKFDALEVSVGVRE